MVLLDWIGQRMFRLFAEPCVAFLEAKRQKLSMKSILYQSTRRGEIIHSEVCGPMSIVSLGESRYFVTFIEEFSGYKSVVPIARKSDVANEFKKYHVWLERRYDCSIKRLHCDEGEITLSSILTYRVTGLKEDLFPRSTLNQSPICTFCQPILLLIVQL